MKIIRPYAKIMARNAGRLLEGMDEGALQKIEWCARISHRMEDKQTEDSWKRFIQNVVIDHGDWSVVEHVSVSVDAVVDRGITHEWVRHRLFSYTQESTRFVNYEKKIPPSFIYPKPDVECELCLAQIEFRSPDGELHCHPWYHPSHIPYKEENGMQNYVECKYDQAWLESIEMAEIAYRGLLAKGWRPQEARSVFPNALASRIIVTGNLRNWRHFFIMRTTQETHPQMKQVTIPLLKEFQETFPILFDDIVPLQKQSESMSKIR